MQRILLNRYLAKFDELNTLFTNIVNANSKKQAREAFDDILIDAYIEGFASAAYILGDINIDNALMYQALNKQYEGITIQDKAEKYYADNDFESLRALLDSEYHRVYNTARNDAYKGHDKRWVTVGDDKVRLTHDFLDGVTVGADERFYTYDGDSALFPGDFTSAENNANCRCIIDYLP